MSQAAVRVRMKFTKQGAVRFLSHLDLLKCLERGLRRAQIPVAYTEGFHPRMRISFGPALALGHASRCEWMDVDVATSFFESVEDEASGDAALGASRDDTGFERGTVSLTRRLNAALPEGLQVLAARIIDPTSRSLQTLLRRAVYRVEIDLCKWDLETLRLHMQAFLAQQEIWLKKKTNKEVNLRAFVHELRIAKSAGPALDLTLGLGPEGSVRPEDVLGSLAPHGEVRAMFIERTELFACRDGMLEEPWSA